jgi:hypothetical protein
MGPESRTVPNYSPEPQTTPTVVRRDLGVRCAYMWLKPMSHACLCSKEG